MKSNITTSFLLFILLTTIGFHGFIVESYSEEETKELGFIINRKITYVIPDEGKKTWNLTDEDRTIGLFMNNTWQTVRLINCSHDLETIKLDDDGNPTAVLSFPKSELIPGEKLSFTFTHHVVSQPRSLPDVNERESGDMKEIPEDLKEKYSKNTGPWLVNDTEIQSLTYNITGGETKVLSVVRKLIVWIWSRIEIPKDPPKVPHDVPLYPDETLRHREGDCDDQANLFITMCRVYGIPAYLQIGVVYDPTMDFNGTRWNGHLKAVQKRIAGHGWAMVYIPPWGWLPVDLTYPTGGFTDPLNAIKTALVTSQRTIQNINVTQTDYIASELNSIEFLEKNDFYVWVESEMLKETPQIEPDAQNIERVFQVVSMTAALVLVAVVYVYLKRTNRIYRRQ